MEAGIDMLTELDLALDPTDISLTTPKARFFEPIARILSQGSDIADDPALESRLLDVLEQLNKTATLVANMNREFLLSSLPRRGRAALRPRQPLKTALTKNKMKNWH